MVIRHWRWTLFINFYLTFLFKNLYFGFCGRGLIAASNSHPWLWKLKCHALMALGHQVTRHLPLLLPLLRSFANITFLWDSFGGRRWQGYPTKHVLCCSVTILLVLPGGDPYPQLTSVLWQPPSGFWGHAKCCQAGTTRLPGCVPWRHWGWNEVHQS